MQKNQIAEQTLISLPVHEDFSADDFLTMPSNEFAVQFINQWGSLKGPKNTILFGPKGCGKTHLLSIWKNLYNGIIIDRDSFSLEKLNQFIDYQKPIAIDRIDDIIAQSQENEIYLFHFYNLMKEAGLDCFFVASQALEYWSLHLKDLKTRLNTFHLVGINPPEQELITYVLMRLFHTRQLILTPQIISYLVKQVQKKGLNARKIVDWIDQNALKEKRKISLNFVKEQIKMASSRANATVCGSDFIKNSL